MSKILMELGQELTATDYAATRLLATLYENDCLHGEESPVTWNEIMNAAASALRSAKLEIARLAEELNRQRNK